MEIGLIFAGQGAQHPGMGAKLYAESREARELYERADAILGWSVSKMCFEGTMEDLTACAHCQPAIYVTSLAAVAARFPEGLPDGGDGGDGGDRVTICGGLSLGELAAFTTAGVMSFEDGLRTVAERGRLMDDACVRNPGGMTAVIGAPEEEVAKICASCGIDVANYNCEGQLIVSGTKEGLAKAHEALAAIALKVVPLEVAGAYHSRLMHEAGLRFREYLDTVPFSGMSLLAVHNVTGELAFNNAESIRDRLAKQLYSPVQWASCAKTMTYYCEKMFEFGPGHVLAGLMKRISRKFPVESTDL